jgi:hypothetical protein
MAVSFANGNAAGPAAFRENHDRQNFFPPLSAIEPTPLAGLREMDGS